MIWIAVMTRDGVKFLSETQIEQVVAEIEAEKAEQ